MAEQLWGGRFSKSTDEMINDFQASIDFDKRMYNEDIAGSIAHATMLAKVGIISETDRDDIIKGLKDIYKKIEEGYFSFEVALEDIHMNIEEMQAKSFIPGAAVMTRWPWTPICSSAVRLWR